MRNFKCALSGVVDYVDGFNFRLSEFYEWIFGEEMEGKGSSFIIIIQRIEKNYIYSETEWKWKDDYEYN